MPSYHMIKDRIPNLLDAKGVPYEKREVNIIDTECKSAPE